MTETGETEESGETGDSACCILRSPRCPRLPRSLMVTPNYTVACLRNREIARDTWEFALEKPEGFSYKPGQFVLFQVGLIENPADIQPRAFSLASAPGEKELLFVAKMKAGGRASRWIEEQLRAGSRVTFQGPFGNFVLRESERPILFIATSTGIAPFRSMWEQGIARPVDFVFGMRSEEDMFWVEEARRYLPESKLHVALTRPSDGWKGRRGRVQTVIPEVAPDIAARDVYVCGNPDMAKELKKMCLETWGVPKAQLHVEGYL